MYCKPFFFIFIKLSSIDVKKDDVQVYVGDCLNSFFHHISNILNVQFQKIAILCPQKGLEFPGGWGVL